MEQHWLACVIVRLLAIGAGVAIAELSTKPSDPRTGPGQPQNGDAGGGVFGPVACGRRTVRRPPMRQSVLVPSSSSVPCRRFDEAAQMLTAEPAKRVMPANITIIDVPEPPVAGSAPDGEAAATPLEGPEDAGGDVEGIELAGGSGGYCASTVDAPPSIATVAANPMRSFRALRGVFDVVLMSVRLLVARRLGTMSPVDMISSSLMSSYSIAPTTQADLESLW